MKRAKPVRRYRDLTYRTKPCDARLARLVATYLYKKQVVVYMPKTNTWRRGRLVAVLPAEDWFKVRWLDGSSSKLRGLWRVHHAVLFRGQRHLHVPKKPAKISRVNHQPKRRATMAATKRTAKKGAGRKKAGSSNGKVSLRELSQAEQRKLASQIKALRKDKVPWDGDDGICEQLGLSSALQGRDLLRKFGGDSLIREREAAPAKKSTKAKAKAKPRASSRRRAAADDDDVPAPRRRKKKVTVKRGRGRAANPS